MSKTMRNVTIFLTGVLLTFLMVAPSLAWAASADPEVTLENQGEGVSVGITLPETAPDDMGAVQLSLNLNVVSGGLEKAEFLFADSLAAEVREYRYHADTGLLTVYLAGAQKLFEGHSLNLGTVVLTANDDAGVRVSVAAVPDSLKMVNKAFSESAPALFSAKPVEAVVGNGGVSPSPDPLPGGGKDDVVSKDVAPEGENPDQNGGAASVSPGISLLNTGDSFGGILTGVMAVAFVVSGVLFIATKRRSDC